MEEEIKTSFERRTPHTRVIVELVVVDKKDFYLCFKKFYSRLKENQIGQGIYIPLSDMMGFIENVKGIETFMKEFETLKASKFFGMLESLKQIPLTSIGKEEEDNITA